MGTTADKLQAILNSKRAIKEALIAKGAAITDQTKFSLYAAVISLMSTGSSDIGDAYVVVEEDGVLKAQKLSFEGTTATPDGAAEAIDNVGLFATGIDEPAYNGSGTGGTMKFYKCASVVAPLPQEPLAALPYFVVLNAVTYPDLNGIYKYAGEYDGGYGNCPLYILLGTTNILYYHNTDLAWYISPSLVINHLDKTFAGEYPYYKADANTDATLLSLTEFRNFESLPDITCKKYVPSVLPEEVPKTWSGYELVYNPEGYYELSDVKTDGLSYSGITPEIGLIYNVDATLRIDLYYEGANAIPKAGLVLHVPLANETSTAETGQTITKRGNPTYQVIDGVPCVYVNQYSNSLTINSARVPDGDEPTTWSLWVKEVNGTGYESSGHLISMKSSGPIDGIDYCQGICFKPDYYACGVYGKSYLNIYEPLDSKWHNIIMTRDSNGVYSIYCDGVLKASDTITTLGDNGGFIALGYLAYYSSWGATGYVSNIRIYNRVLSQDEITTLSNEFTPTIV